MSAHTSCDENDLVSAALAQHRERREAAIAMLTERSAKAPLPAVGYQLPLPSPIPADAGKLAVRMEDDCAVAWRAVIEQATAEQDRAFGVTALTECGGAGRPLEAGARRLAGDRGLPWRQRIIPRAAVSGGATRRFSEPFASGRGES